MLVALPVLRVVLVFAALSMGSPTLVRWLLRLGLLDELTLVVMPIVLGKGRRLFEDGGDPLPSSPEDYAADIDREEAKWSRLIRKLNLKVE